MDVSAESAHHRFRSIQIKPLLIVCIAVVEMWAACIALQRVEFLLVSFRLLVALLLPPGRQLDSLGDEFYLLCAMCFMLWDLFVAVPARHRGMRPRHKEYCGKYTNRVFSKI